MASPRRARDQTDESPIDSSILRSRLAKFRYPSSDSPASPTESAPLPTPPVTPGAGIAGRRVSPRKRSSSSSVHLQGPRSPHFNRASSSSSAEVDAEDKVEDMPSSRKKKKKKPPRPFADPSVYADIGVLEEQLRPGLNVIMCGINPGVESGRTNTHYAHPTNHFWRCIAASGFSPRLLTPLEGRDIINIASMGMTNLCSRATAEASELSLTEMRASVPVFLKKLLVCKPKVVAFAGMQICDLVRRYLHLLPPLPVSEDDRKPALDLASSPEFSSAPERKSKGKSKSSVSGGRRKAMGKTVCGLQPVVLSYPSLDNKDERMMIYFVALPSPSARVTSYQLKDKIVEFTKLKAYVDTLTSPTAQTLPRLTFPSDMTVVDIPLEDLERRMALAAQAELDQAAVKSAVEVGELAANENELKLEGEATSPSRSGTAPRVKMVEMKDLGNADVESVKMEQAADV